MGHMKKIRMKIRPTNKATPTALYQQDMTIYSPIPTYTTATTLSPNMTPRSVVNNVIVKVIPVEDFMKDLTNPIAIDQAG